MRTSPVIPSGTAVFVSFSSSDIAIAEELVRAIEARGARTFFAPRDIRVGENFANRIIQAIVESDTLVVVLSKAAIESPHVRREVSLAIEERRRILPVLVPGVEFPRDFTTEWAYWLSAVQVHNLRSVSDLARLVVGEAAAPAPREVERPGEVDAAERPETSAIHAASPVVLLRAERRIVPFSGRDEDLARLDAWLHRSDPISVRLITASGGEGKSRLADEFAARSEAVGWTTARLRDVWRPQDMSGGRYLLVVDYAETKAAAVSDLLSRMSVMSFAGPIRILLLARGAGDWWRTLSSASPETEDLLADATVQSLRPLRDDRDASRAIYADAVAAFARALHVAPPDVVTLPDFYESLLDLLQRALLSVLSDSDEGAPDRVAARLLGHERRYVRATAGTDLQDYDDMDFERIAVMFSLFPPRDEPEAIELAALAQPTATPTELRKLARLFRRLYPSEKYYSSGLKPDAVAERALAGLLAEEGAIPGGASAWHRADAVHLESALRLLSRAAASAPPARKELARLVPTLDLDAVAIAVRVALQIEAPKALVDALQDAAQAGAFDDRLEALLVLLPEETVTLAEVAAVVAERIVMTRDTSADASASGRLLLDASNRFSDAGWSERALQAASDGIAMLRTAHEDPTDDLLLGALSNLSNRMWETGDLADALVTARDALAQAPADADALDVVAARNNLAFRCIELGLYDEAAAELVAARAAVEHLAESGPMMRVRLQAVASNEVCLAAASRQWERAVDLSTALIETRRLDFAQQRDRNIAYLARALANGALPRAATGDVEGARALIAEARTLHRLTALKAPIFRFEAAESALVESIVCLLAGESARALLAARSASAELEATDASLGSLRTRLESAIGLASAAAAEGRHIARGDISAIGSRLHTDDGVEFPLLLEYKDLS